MAEPVDRRANPIFAPADQTPSYVTPGDPVQEEELPIEEDRRLDRLEEIRATRRVGADPAAVEIVEDRSYDRIEEIRATRTFGREAESAPDRSWERAEEIKFQALTTDATEEAVGDSLPATLPYQTNIDHSDALRRLDDQFAMDTVAGDSTVDAPTADVPEDVDRNVNLDADANIDNAELTEY